MPPLLQSRSHPRDHRRMRSGNVVSLGCVSVEIEELHVLVGDMVERRRLRLDLGGQTTRVLQCGGGGRANERYKHEANGMRFEKTKYNRMKS